MNKSCPKCSSEHIYPDRELWICPDCAYEWTSEQIEELNVVSKCIDAHGQNLQSGDSVTLVKDLKVKGAASSLKKGTKVKNIQVIDPIDGHNISCRVEGFGALNLKSEYVKKA